MFFNQNYAFFDLPTASQTFQDLTKRDFESNFRILLKNFTDKPSEPLSDCLYTLMAKRHYHSPVHILSMFQFAEDIQLTHFQQFAIWFHDAIYYTDSPKGVNEEASCHFMRAMLSPFLDSHALFQIASIITATAEHMSVEPMLEESALVCDLDLCVFSWPDWAFNAATAALESEYDIPVPSDYFPPTASQVFKAGRKDFLKKLLGRGFVYRTELFRDRFEKRAVNRIERAIR